jgi:excisionase family DNA binding protein
MPETKAEMCSGNLETALFELIRNAVRTEVQEISKLRSDQDRLLTIDQVAQTLSVSKDWIYRNEKRFTFTRKLGPKMVRFSETGLQKWLRDKGR